MGGGTDEMELLIGLVIVLIISYGLVVFIQHQSEFHKSMDAVTRERNRVAGLVSTLQAECEFIHVYREGESGRIAEELAHRIHVLEAVFKETIDDLDKLVIRKYNRLDRQVHLARVMESFDKMNREISDFREKLNAFHETLDKSRQEIAPLQSQFEKAKSTISGILGEVCPHSWLDHWHEIERTMTKLSLAQGDEDKPLLNGNVSEHVELWMETAQSVSVWSEWKKAYDERMRTFTSCINKLSTNGAKHSRVAGMLEQIIEQANQVIALNPEQLVEKGTFQLCQKLNRDLPIVLSIVMQFLSVLSKPQSAATVRVRLASEAEKVLKEIQTQSFLDKERQVEGIENEWLEIANQKPRLKELLDVAISHVQNETASSANDFISDIDNLLSIPILFHQYMNQVEKAHIVHITGNKELDARISALLSNISQALAKLAGVKLADSDEYRKLSKWWDELDLMESNETINAQALTNYERRVANELVIVDGLVRGHESLDASLQRHFDRLSHSGRYSGTRVGIPSDMESRRSGTDDLLSVAFTTLMIGEILGSDSFNSNFDTW